MCIKHLLTALLIFPVSICAKGFGSEWTATSALQFQQQSNTKVAIGDNVISFYTGAAERMTLDANGNLGLGTTAPTAKLHISDGDLLLQNLTSGYPRLWLKDVSGNNTLKFDYNSISGDGDNLYIRSGATNVLALNDNGGNVGIGTSSPSYLLDIESLNTPRIQLQDLTNAVKLDLGADDNRAFIQTQGAHNIDFYTNSIYRMTINSVGQVGIGTNAPTAKFHLVGNNTWGGGMRITNASNYWDIAVDGGGDRFYIGNDQSMDLVINASSGNVGIGTAGPSHKLHVVGNAHASTYSADSPPSWPDYVFQDSYELNNIQELEKYIKDHHHLPEIPSAKEVKENGVNLVSMQAKLLQKIEELTLYVIEQNKQLEEQNQQIEDLQQQYLQMNKQIQSLAKK